LCHGGIPTATIVPWSSASVPSGFLECNGAAVSRTTYAALFAIVGTTYGVGDGATTFNVPDLQDNVAVGKSPGKALASSGGANTVASTGNVGGSTANATLTEAQLAAHSHPAVGANNFNTQGSPNFPIRPQSLPGSNTGSAGSDSGHSHNMSATFSGDATSVLQPYLTIIYIIKT
jgi:microcystin-dependent protein